MLLSKSRVLRRYWCLIRLKMSATMVDIPWGIAMIQRATNTCCPVIPNKQILYKFSIVFLTYIAYTCYHMTRKPISVVKAVLHPNCTGLTPPPGINVTNNSHWCAWAPFDTDGYSQLFGALDSVFLSTYAIAMFASGFIAERVNLRYYLSLGMILSGALCYLFGLAKTYEIHQIWYFIFVQFFAGIFQTTGWPGVVTVMTRWFGKAKRGLIFGLWNSHTSLGNIVGCLIPAEYVETDWAYSFIVPGLIMAVVGFILFLFLVVDPRDVGCEPEPEITQRPVAKRLTNQVANDSGRGNSSNNSSETEDTEILIGEEEVQRRATERSRLLPGRREDKAIGFCSALRFPGVIEYSLCLFFSKLVSYTFLYWLPSYVKHQHSTFGAKYSADLSTLFDVGGAIGAIAAGAISDASNMPAATCAGMLALAAPMMYVYESFGNAGMGVNMMLLIIAGALVNGPYALITTAVASEIGSVASSGGGQDRKALATVTAIIDGTGSIGAAIGPLMASFVQGYGWNYVFIMLIASDLLALVFLIRLFKAEISRCRSSPRNIRIE